MATIGRQGSSNPTLDDLQTVDDVRIRMLQPLLPPSILLDEIPLTDKASHTVLAGRDAINRAIRGKDDRLVVIVGPCSIHDVQAAEDYAEKLYEESQKLSNDLIVVMRVYFEKPRTTVGWKGLINDPDLDNTFKINKGLRIARKLLVKVNEMGLPCAVEFLDTISPQFVADLVSWGAIGARTTESQIHRELASGLSMPVGFKNGTAGDVGIACDAVLAAKHPHTFLSVTKQGLAAIVHTRGNPYCHLILRGGKTGPNYSESDVTDAVKNLTTRGAQYKKIIIDCSHGNSEKDHNKQPGVAEEVARQVAEGAHHILGVMVESHLVAGNQKLGNKEDLVYGQSITDACIDFETTKVVLNKLAEAVQLRRKRPRAE